MVYQILTWLLEKRIYLMSKIFKKEDREVQAFNADYGLQNTDSDVSDEEYTVKDEWVKGWREKGLLYAKLDYETLRKIQKRLEEGRTKYDQTNEGQPKIKIGKFVIPKTLGDPDVVRDCQELSKLQEVEEEYKHAKKMRQLKKKQKEQIKNAGIHIEGFQHSKKRKRRRSSARIHTGPQIYPPAPIYVRPTKKGSVTKLRVKTLIPEYYLKKGYPATRKDSNTSSETHYQRTPSREAYLRRKDIEAEIRRRRVAEQKTYGYGYTHDHDEDDDKKGLRYPSHMTTHHSHREYADDESYFSDLDSLASNAIDRLKHTFKRIFGLDSPVRVFRPLPNRDPEQGQWIFDLPVPHYALPLARQYPKNIKILREMKATRRPSFHVRAVVDKYRWKLKLRKDGLAACRTCCENCRLPCCDCTCNNHCANCHQNGPC